MPGDDERKLFRRKMSDVVRQKADVVPPHRRRPAPIPHQRRREELEIMENLANNDMDATEFATGDELLFHQPGVQRRVIRKLRRGTYSVTAELDLHGYTVQQAHERLCEFLLNLDRGRQTCVRIVHGKGLGSPGREPVLRNKVAVWLACRRDVLAYCSAPRHDGGLGALYVLLKQR
ncbi:MAG: putative DNA endonuclease SmrA [Gammaproteobacteria bacterium]|nr:putative DNA endonuclease SmrA [Gammaproteobacteria bacterium]